MTRSPLCWAVIALLAPHAVPQQASHDVDRIAFSMELEKGRNTVQIEMRVHGLQRDQLTVAMPIWKPGSYTVRNYGNKVIDLAASSPDGAALAVAQGDQNSWSIDSKGHTEIIIRYGQSLRRRGIGPASRDEAEDGSVTRCHSAYLFEGPGTWLYIPGRIDVPHEVSFDLPEDWRVATGLRRTDDPRSFTAPDYDVFADCPMHIGLFERLEFEVAGIEYAVVLSGFKRSRTDRKTLASRFKRIVEASLAMMGPAPYDRYVFLVRSGGAGGLEHLNSTNIAMMALPASSRTNSIWDSLIAHEFFHLWNVKRLRPRALGPFDYGAVDPNRTRYLWVCEGFTSYYGGILCVRAGLWDAERYWTGDIAREINMLQRNPGRLKMSVAEASWTVWDAPYGRRGFTAPDYYNKGQLLGLLLDVEIRDATDGKKSLDDVMRGLNEQCAETGEGFADGDVRRWCEKVAGRDFEEFFASYVEGTEELPFAATLTKIGLIVTEPTLGEDGRRRGRWKIELDPEAAERAVALRSAMTALR